MAVAVVDEHVHTTLPVVRIVVRGVASYVGALDVESVPLSDATEMWAAFDQIERMAAGAKVLLAARVAQSGDWRRSGARSAAEHLARLGRTSTQHARRALENSKELPALLVSPVRCGAESCRTRKRRR